MGTKKVKAETKLDPFKMFLYLCLIGFITFLLVEFTMLTKDPYMDRHHPDVHTNEADALLENLQGPVILWWTPFMAQHGAYRQCGWDTCFFTIDRHYLKHTNTVAIMFYGSDLNITDLPLPRAKMHQWALLHEESPKNNFVLTQPDFIELFNHSSTFKRESDFPLTLQYVESAQWLESKQYLVQTSEKNKLLSRLTLVFYAQSDCNVPSDRDSLVNQLIQYVKIDSYGACVHNKDLPEHVKNPLPGMNHEDFFKIQAQYKFSLALENAICDDYITEKIWRPLMLGSVPIIRGSPKIKELLPDNHSAIIVDDFRSVEELADYLKFLNSNDDEYNKYLHWKTTGVTNERFLTMMKSKSWSIKDTGKEKRTNFVEAYECFICNRVTKILRSVNAAVVKYTVNKTHLECPEPRSIDNQLLSMWHFEYESCMHQAKAIRYFANKNIPMTKGDFHAKLSEIQYQNKKE